MQWKVLGNRQSRTFGGREMKAVLWSIRRPHTDNIKNGNKWDEIRKRIPKDLTRETVNYIYETKANGEYGNHRR